MKIISNTATEIVFEAEETPREYHITPAKENVQELAKEMGLL